MTSHISFREKIVCTFGPPGSGKTNFVKHVFRQPQYSRHIIFDPMREYDSDRYNVYRPENRRYDDGGNDELNLMVSKMVTDTRGDRTRPKYVIIDEANRVLPNGKAPGGPVQDLIDFNRHYAPGIGVWFVSRRPAQLNTDAENLANHTFVFGGKGKNDYRAYRDIHRKLPDYLDAKRKYEFAHVTGTGDIQLMSPVADLGDTPKL